MGDLVSGSVSSDSDGVPSTGSVPEPNRVLLAKIFMVAMDPRSCQKPKEWNGVNPGHTNRLFVYAHIDNSTYESYVTLSDLSRKRLIHVSSLGDGRPFHRGYDKLMQTGPFSKYLESCIHNPRGYDSYRYPNSPELETVLRNLMSGTLSFVNSRDALDLHRIYVFDPPPTMGIESSWHPEVTNPEYTYWYRLNNSSGLDRPTQGPPDGETIRDIAEDEFTSNYKIFQNFKKANPHRFVLSRETYGNFGKMLEGIHKPNTPTRYLPIHPRAVPTPRRGGKKHSKRRNKTRRKYRKIKSRRRRVIR